MKTLVKVFCCAAVLSFLVMTIPGFSYGAPEVSLRYAGDLPIGNHLTRGQEFFAKLRLVKDTAADLYNHDFAAKQANILHRLNKRFCLFNRSFHLFSP